MRSANQVNDFAGTALAQLYLADIYARYERLAEGVNWARRAAKRFRLLGNNHNTMVAHLLLAHLEHSLHNLDQARRDYQQALDMCQKLQMEEKRTARREAAWYGEIAEEIRSAIAEVSTTVVGRFDQTRHLDSIPVLNLSDGPDAAIGEHSDRAGHVTATGTIIIAGRTYRLYPLDRALENGVELRPGAVYFALAIAEDGWLDPMSKEGEYALVQWKPQVIQEGPGVLWTGEKWIGGQFKRDLTTGDIHFVSPQPHIIGEERGYVVALLKPVL